MKPYLSAQALKGLKQYEYKVHLRTRRSTCADQLERVLPCSCLPVWQAPRRVRGVRAHTSHE